MIWESVLEAQSIWARKLLKHTCFDAIDTVLEPISKKNPGTFFLMVQPSARWIISTTKGQRLASCQGSCAGRPSSLCGEASRMLSSSLFITILKIHYRCTFQGDQLGFMADNLELITQLNDHRQYIKSYPNTTLGAEFD